jgi:hypothetical protein
VTYKELENCFSPLESSGLEKLPINAQIPVLEYEGMKHVIVVNFLDLYATIRCEILLKEIRDAPVDAYSLIAFFRRDLLVEFLNQKIKLDDHLIGNFLCKMLTVECAKVFEMTKPTDWIKLYEFHRQSWGRRNKTFWERVSGYGEIHYGAGPTSRATF